MAQNEKPDKSETSQKAENVRKGFMSIPEGEMDDMKKEYERVARKRREVKTEKPA